MASEIQNGRFREDLYYRLNVFPLMTSCLADRPGDILPISTVLLKRHSADLSGIPSLDDSAVAMLSSYDWPGNVRELENVLQRALVLMTGQTITATEIVMDNALQNINTLAGKTQIEPRQLMQQGA